MSAPARLVLVGVRGFGQVHGARIGHLVEQRAAELVAAVDPGVTTLPDGLPPAPLHADLGEALEATGPVDVVVVAAPINHHFTLAETALRAGADVLLEKPPVATLAQFEQLLATTRETGRLVQVGFQSLGSTGPAGFRADAFGIGPVNRVGAVGVWSRSVGYWSRSPWAGHRSLHGQPVVDGVVTNPLAHAVATALAVVDAHRLDDVASVETELYRANAIDSDDTSVVRVRTTAGREVTAALTLCAPVEREPLLHVEGTRGHAVYSYTTDRVTLPHGRTATLTRTNLLENLLASRRDGTPLLVPLAETGAFMRVLAAVGDAEEPVRIDPRAVTWHGTGADRRPVVEDVEPWLERAAATGRTLTELGVPWAHAGRDRVLVRVRVEGDEVAGYRDGRGTIPTSSPRPFLHPVRTRAGVVVTAQHPADHDWHTGVGMAIPDVDGTNFWGGGSYAPGTGYVLRHDHGEVVGDPPEERPGGFRQRLRWVARDGSVALHEERHVDWEPLDERTWRLGFSSALRSDRGATLNSPGSKGRPDGGYGGFFWRFPTGERVEVLTPTARGEEEVQGRVAPWLAVVADFTAAPGASGPATVVLASADAVAAGDPWFVRVRSYPGVGSALAWDRPVRLAAGAVLHRRVDVAVADGRLDSDEVAALAAQLAAVPV